MCWCKSTRLPPTNPGRSRPVVVIHFYTTRSAILLLSFLRPSPRLFAIAIRRSPISQHFRHYHQFWLRSVGTDEDGIFLSWSGSREKGLWLCVWWCAAFPFVRLRQFPRLLRKIERSPAKTTDDATPPSDSLFYLRHTRRTFDDVRYVLSPSAHSIGCDDSSAPLRTHHRHCGRPIDLASSHIISSDPLLRLSVWLTCFCLSIISASFAILATSLLVI